METDLIERKCENCTYNPCYKLTQINLKVCELHKFEHEKLIEGIEKLKREGYQDWEGMR